MNGWDRELFWQINKHWTHPVLDQLMPSLSAIDAWLPVFGVLLLTLLWRGTPRVRLMLLCLAVSLVCSDAIVGNGLKKLFHRVRPRDEMSGVEIRDLAFTSPRFLALFQPAIHKPSKVLKAQSEGNSLPSNHTMNLFAAATVVALFFRGWGLFVYVIAFGVAYSRVYVGAHWPSDIPPSAALGMLLGLIATHIITRSVRKTAPVDADAV